MVTEFTSENFDISQGITVVDFWAPWCGPCKQMSPVFVDVAEGLKEKATFGKINVDENTEIAGQYGVMSIPTIIVFKDGQEVDRFMGAMSKEDFSAKLSGILN